MEGFTKPKNKIIEDDGQELPFPNEEEKKQTEKPPKRTREELVKSIQAKRIAKEKLDEEEMEELQREIDEDRNDNNPHLLWWKRLNK